MWWWQSAHLSYSLFVPYNKRPKEEENSVMFWQVEKYIQISAPNIYWTNIEWSKRLERKKKKGFQVLYVYFVVKTKKEENIYKL